MKSWGQLSKVERVAALKGANDLLLTHILEGFVEVNMPNRILKRDFDRILSDVRKNEIGPDLAKKILMSHVAIGRELVKLTVAVAEGSRYDNSGSFLMEEV